MKEINLRQRQFIEEYLRCYNATEAARRAGYKGDYTTLGVTGHNLLKNSKIKAAISVRFQESAMSADEVIMRLAEQARADYSEYITETGVDLKRLVADGKAHLVKKIKPGAYGLEIEFVDSQSALFQIGKAHGLFVDKSEIKTDAPPAEQIVIILPDNGRNDI